MIELLLWWSCARNLSSASTICSFSLTDESRINHYEVILVLSWLVSDVGDTWAQSNFPSSADECENKLHTSIILQGEAQTSMWQNTKKNIVLSGGKLNPNPTQLSSCTSHSYTCHTLKGALFYHFASEYISHSFISLFFVSASIRAFYVDENLCVSPTLII